MTFTGDMMSRLGKIPASFVFTKGATPSEFMLTITGTGEKGSGCNERHRELQKIR